MFIAPSIYRFFNFDCISLMFALLTPYLFESSVQFSKQDRTSSNIPSAFCFLILVSLASFNRCSILGFLPSPITVVLCSPPGPEEKVKSYAGESLQCPSSSIKKLKFLEWSSLLCVSTLNVANLNAFSTSRTSRVSMPVNVKSYS